MDKIHFMRPTSELLGGLEKLISRLPNRVTMAEMGSFAGESTEIFAKKGFSVYAVDMWQGISCTANIKSDEEAEDIEARFDLVATKYPNITKIKESSHEAYKHFDDSSLDFIYIDDVHEYDFCKKNLQLWISKLKYNGWIGGHDYNKKDFPGIVKIVDEMFGDKVEVFEDTSWLVRVRDEKITVLMPVFNREKYVGEAIESILRQTHDNFELIIYDDGSKDNSVSIIKEYANKDSRIRFIDGKKNFGIPESRNILLDACKTRLACWADSDDVSNKYRLEVQHEYGYRGKNQVFTHKRLTSYFNDHYIYDTPKLDIIEDGSFKCPSCEAIGFRCDSCTPCNMFPVDKTIRFDPLHVPVSEDCFWIQAMAKKYPPILIKEVLYFLRDHCERITNKANIINKTLSRSEIVGCSYERILEKVQDRVGGKRCVVTIACGKFYKEVAKHTHWTIEAYAYRCGADFRVFSDDDVPDKKDQWSKACWMKFKILELFDREGYDEIIYVDTDMIIGEETENLFTYVPKGMVGMFNEYPFSKVWVDHTYGLYLDTLKLIKSEYIDGKYYNAGLMLVRKENKKIFTLPDSEKYYENTWELCAEQSYFNINIKRLDIPMFDIGPKFNAFVSREENGLVSGLKYSEIRISHLAGIFSPEVIARNDSDFILKTFSELHKKLKFGVSIHTIKPKLCPTAYEKISVLMPVYNREKYVGDAIESIIKQTHKNWELIVVDDASTDRTSEILSKYSSMDKRIRVIRNNKNLGVAACRNILLDACNTDYAAFQDSDDLSNIYRLEFQKQFVRWDLMVWGNCYAFPNNIKVNFMEYPISQPHKIPCTPSIMFPVRKNIRYDESKITGGEDDIWVENMKKDGCKEVRINDILYFYRVHHERITEIKDRINKNISVEERKDKSYAELVDILKSKGK